jgi:hypothetical protein
MHEYSVVVQPRAAHRFPIEDTIFHLPFDNGATDERNVL